MHEGSIELQKAAQTFTIPSAVLAIQLQQYYGLTVTGDFTHLAEGYINANLKFTSAGQDYVVRLYANYQETTQLELKVQMELNKLGVATPELLTDIRGNIVNVVSGYHYLVCKFVPGQHPTTDLETVRRVGSFTAKSLKAFAKTAVVIDRPLDTFDYFQQRGELCANLQNNWPAVVEIFSDNDVEVIAGLIDLYIESTWTGTPAPKQPIHGDFYSNNLLDNGSSLVLLDFETIDFDHPEIDFCTYIACDLLNGDEHGGNSAQILARCSSYLDGYRAAGGEIADADFCTELLSFICLQAALSNVSQAIHQGWNAWDRYQRYYQNARFAIAHRHELRKMFASKAPLN